jgi:hypothetical protein
MPTAFFHDERTLWHAGGNYALTVPVGGLVQPMTTGGFPESPETKRRLKNLLDVTGLIRDLDLRTAPEADRGDLRRIHPASYLAEFKRISDTGGGELGRRTPFGRAATRSRPSRPASPRPPSPPSSTAAIPTPTPSPARPGHHCLPDFPNGFCLLANIAIAIEAALRRPQGRPHRGARLGRPPRQRHRGDLLRPPRRPHRLDPPGPQLPDGHRRLRRPGRGRGRGAQPQHPPAPRHRPQGLSRGDGAPGTPRNPRLPPRRHRRRLRLRRLGRRPARPDALLGRHLPPDDPNDHGLAADICGGRLVLVHEGGYSEVHVPFCGHAVLEELSGSAVTAPDPLAETIALRQPSPAFDGFVSQLIGEMAGALPRPPA